MGSLDTHLLFWVLPSLCCISMGQSSRRCTSWSKCMSDKSFKDTWVNTWVTQLPLTSAGCTKCQNVKYCIYFETLIDLPKVVWCVWIQQKSASSRWKTSSMIVDKGLEYPVLSVHNNHSTSFLNIFFVKKKLWFQQGYLCSPHRGQDLRIGIIPLSHVSPALAFFAAGHSPALVQCSCALLQS